MLSLFLSLCCAWQSSEPVREFTVGMTGRISQLVLPGNELEAKPYNDRKLPVLLRVRSVKAVGTDYQYEIEFQGFDPGTYDLRDYLRRKDGSSLDGVPAIKISIVPIRPPGQVEPNALQLDQSFWLGGYRWWLILGGVLWFAGLAAIIYYGFWPRRKSAAGKLNQPVTLADRLRPLVERAISGQAKPAELASLERCLHSWWRQKLGMDDQAIQQSTMKLQEHEQAGPLLQQLELWLHRPGTQQQVDVSRLLEPYRNVEAHALDRWESAA